MPSTASPSPTPAGRHSVTAARIRRIAAGRDPDLTAVDGRKLVAELLASGLVCTEIVVAEDALEALARFTPCAAWPPIYVLDRRTFASLAPSQHSQGVLAITPVPQGRIPLAGTVVFLDQVQEPGNVGAVIRCAAAFGASGVACSSGCGDPFSPRAIRAAAGWSLRYPVEREVDFDQLAAAIAAAGGTVAAADGHRGTEIEAWRPRFPVLLALGSEGQGLSDAVAARAVQRVTIPLSGGVESLNIAVAAGVILAALACAGVSPILECESHAGRVR